MINSYISQQIERNFPYKPTDDQFLALHTLTEFLLSEEPDSLLLMKGYARSEEHTSELQSDVCSSDLA